jgi:hypothetical protein
LPKASITALILIQDFVVAATYCCKTLLQMNSMSGALLRLVVVSVFSALAVSAVCGAEREQEAETKDGKNDKDKCTDLFDLWMK